MLPIVHIIHQFLRDHALFEKNPENRTGKELFNPLDIIGVYFSHGIAITFPVSASASNKGMDIRVPVGHTPKGLGHKDATEENIPTIKG